jgi:hypothetical protein
MPVFSFEKISPPLPDASPAAPAQKPKGVIVQMIDRFVEARVKRTVLEEKAAIRREPKASDE